MQTYPNDCHLLAADVQVDPDTWHLLIRNISGLGFLAILANTFSSLLNGPIVRAIAVKWFDLPVAEVPGQSDLRAEIALLRIQMTEVYATVQLDAEPHRASVNACRLPAESTGPAVNHYGDK